MPLKFRFQRRIRVRPSNVVEEVHKPIINLRQSISQIQKGFGDVKLHRKMIKVYSKEAIGKIKQMGKDHAFILEGERRRYSKNIPRDLNELLKTHEIKIDKETGDILFVHKGIVGVGRKIIEKIKKPRGS